MRLKQIREEKGLSQNELAKKINMTQQRISSYEKGIREPDIETLKILADFFNVSIDYLLGKTDKRNNDKKEELEIHWALNGGYNALNDTNREIARSVIESLLAKQEQENKKDK